MSADAPVRGGVFPIVVAGAGAAAIAAGLTLALTGVTVVPLLFAAAVPWMLWMSARRGVALSGAVVSLAALIALVVLLLLTAAVRAPMWPTLLVVTVVLALAGVALLARGPRLRRPHPVTLAIWLPATLGAFAWFGTMIATVFVPGASRYSWAMLGDSANNLLFAREVIYRGGLGVGPESNPVPLPSALLAIVMAPGRDATAVGELTRHDIGALTQVWGVVIAVMCIVVGVTAASIARAAGARPAVLAVTSAAASLLPLTWFFTGYPIEFGFFNAHVAIPLVLLAVLAFISAPQQPVIGVAAQFLAATTLLSVWSPLAVVPVVLGLVLIVPNLRLLWRQGGSARWLLIASIVQFLAYGLGMVLPTYLAQAVALGAPGGAYPFRHAFIYGLGVGAIAVVFAAFHRPSHVVVRAVVSTVLAGAAGLGALLFVGRDAVTPWTYYPLKFAWLMSAVVIALVFGAAVAVAVRYIRPLAGQLAGVGVVVAGTLVVLSLLSQVAAGPRYPMDRLLAGDIYGDGDQLAEQIFEYATADQAHLMWRSADPLEGSVNFWVLEMWADSMTANLDLRFAAYGLYDVEDPADLCKIVTLMGGDVIVHTADPGLAAAVAAQCPATAAGITYDLAS
jgi:hypothetical protein